MLLDYSRTTLRAAEKYFLERFRWLMKYKDGISLFAVTSAYLTQVAIRNFGGRASYDREADIFTVEDIRNLKIRATPELELAQARSRSLAALLVAVVVSVRKTAGLTCSLETPVARIQSTNTVCWHLKL